ncbi:MAG: mycothiol synthase [Actinomycetota bacterium]|nr:mycothiol synthase [Actinomycetota bacterium]
MHRYLEATCVEAVERLVERAHRADGVAPLNEHAMLHLHDRVDPTSRHLVTTDGDRLTGYAYLDLSGDAATGAECVVSPESRGQGIGGSLVRALVEVSYPRRLTIWSHGDHPAAAVVARRTGLHRVRELCRMQRPLDRDLPELRVPDGLRLRTFRPGADDAAWVALNARAFAEHPEQARLTVEDLRRRQQQPWFDAEGFFVAERDGVMVGFHWTKVEGDLGEVYVVGVSPEAQGSGLGRVLTLRGLHHLRDADLAEVRLYVEADNASAIAVYERLGFGVAGVDVMYATA